ncbi:MAG: hypothetical protein V3T22_07395 [Planctomycetota bacterium]
MDQVAPSGSSAVPVSERLQAFARRKPLLAALALALFLALTYQLFVHAGRNVDSWGWDESTHAELPAARMVVGDVGQAVDALMQCEQYPFVFPLVLAAGQALFGVSENVARGVAFGLWVLVGLSALALLGRELGRGSGRSTELALALPLLSCTSPLVWRYAPSLFLEVPFLTVSTLTLWAWLRRGESAAGWRRGRELLAGALVAAAFFTKWNYGALLAAGLGADWLVESWLETRAGRARSQALRSLWLALPLTAMLSWWFVLPLPAGLEVAAGHREALAGFLAGNRGGATTDWNMRLLHWGTGVARVPWLVVLASGWLLALRCAHRRPTRLLWLVALTSCVPVALHPFHLDRFLIPGLLPLWCLAAVGLARESALGDAWHARLQVGLLLVTSAVLTGVYLSVPPHAVADRLGFLVEATDAQSSRLREYQRHVIDEDWSLAGRVPTAGLPRAVADTLLSLVAQEVKPNERVAWIGMSSELSRAALHLGLLARGGSRARFLADSPQLMDVTPVPGMPLPRFGSDGERDDWLAAETAAFDVVLITSPVDLKGRVGREAIRSRFHAPLMERLGWVEKELGKVSVPRPPGEPLQVTLFALRRP